MTKQPLSGWGRLYVGSVAALGLWTVAHSAYTMYADAIGWNWFVLAILTLVSGSATIKLPSVPATISISETFVFTSVLLFGPAAGTLTVALDALVISLWLARRGHPLYRIVFNVCALPAALWISAHLFYALLPDGFQPLSLATGPVEIRALLKPLFFFTVTYFLLNSWMIAIAISFERVLSPATIWRDNFALLSLNYFGGASIAALLVTYTRNIDFAYIAFVLPLLAVLYMTFAVSMGRVRDANKHLSELNTLYMSTIETLAMAIDAKDQITHGHIRRVQHFAVGLAKAIGVTDKEQINAIEAASLLHDMGKLAVPEYILNKPGPLTPAEFERMKLHASVGADILSAIAFPYPVVPIVRHHHESWDGTGYPDGLRGSDIPIGARILSVVDCFDALTSDRPYRPRLSDAEAIKILLDRRGTMYDPLVVDTFLAVYSQIAPTEDYWTVREGLTAITRAVGTPDYASADAGLDDIASSTEEMLVLYDLAKGLTGHLDLADAGDVISKHLRRIVPASTCVFFVYESAVDELFAAHAAGESATHFAGLRIPRGQRLTGWVAANKRTILNSDPVLDLGDVARVMRPRLMSCLSTPLVIGSELVGVLSLYSTTRDAFSEDHRRIVEVVARQVSQTVRHAVDFQDLRSASLRDHQTGVPTLQHVERFIASEISLASPSSTVSLIFVNCESFHAAGRSRARAGSDAPVLRLTDAIRNCLRGADVLFRHGAGDFVILLTQTEPAAAQAVADRVLAHVATRGLLHIDNGEPPIVSVGVATAPIDGTTIESLVNVARSRERGRPNLQALRPPSVH